MIDKYKMILNEIVCYLKHIFTYEQPDYDLVNDGEKSPYKIKKVAYYVGCQDGRSDRYRVFNFARKLREKGVKVDIYSFDSINWLLKPVEYDILICFREDRYRLARWDRIAKNLHKYGVKIIYDTDDYTVENPNTKSTRNILKIVELSDAITVTTEYLAKLFREVTIKPVYVIKNTINDEQLRIAGEINRNKKIKIVYQSGSNSHNEDFLVAEKALIYILSKYKYVQLIIIGPLEVSEDLMKYNEQIVRIPFMNYLDLQKFVCDMDINIAPLVINKFNNSKSELKIFDASLLKIPTICSAIEPYKDLIENYVNGIIVESTEEWIDAFERLILNEELRRKIGEKAKNDFVGIFSIDNVMNEVIRIQESLIDNG